MLRVTNAEKFLKLERGMWCERIRYIYLVSENYESLRELRAAGAVTAFPQHSFLRCSPHKKLALSV